MTVCGQGRERSRVNIYSYSAKYILKIHGPGLFRVCRQSDRVHHSIVDVGIIWLKYSIEKKGKRDEKAPKQKRIDTCFRE
jgi:hypothetical protein